MNLIKQHLESIVGIEIYPIISFIIFAIVFIAMLIYAFSIKKADIDVMKQIPLDDDTDDNTTD